MSRFMQALVVACCVITAAQGFGVSEILDIVKVGKDVAIAVAKAWNLVDEHWHFSDVPLPLVNKREQAVFNRINIINSKISRIAAGYSDTGSQVMQMLSGMPDRFALEFKLDSLRRNLETVEIANERFQMYSANTSRFERSTLEDFARSTVSHGTNSIIYSTEMIYAAIAPNKQGITSTGLLNNLAKQLAFPEDITYGLEGLDSLWLWARAYDEMRVIYALHGSFRRFQKQQIGRVASPAQAWIDLAETILYDAKSSMPSAMKRLNDIVGKENLFKYAALDVQTGSMICNLNQSPQQVLLNLYNVVALSELKSYTMIQFSYMLLKLYSQENYTAEAEGMKIRHKEITRITLDKMKEVISMASQDFWKCDPAKHEKDVTYTEVTELLQGYVQNEVDLNPEGTCRENCAEYSYTKSHGCYQNLYCRKQRSCKGKIINCKFIDSDAWICPASVGTNRRYEYIKYENGKIFGRDVGCSQGTTKVDSWWRWLFWHCSYCMCLCDEQGSNSDRYFNMRSSEANIASNRVVTGLRFVKKNRIIHLQVQEGLLLPKAKIDPDTVNWVEVENYKITDRGMFNGQDFHTLTWEKRNFDLDDLVGFKDEIVTGVRFKLIGSHLNFEVRFTTFDFDSGKLNVNNSYWKDNANTDASKTPRKKLMLENRDIPTRSPGTSLPDSKSDQYLEFTNTGLEQDAAQTTVPFIDIQPVTSAIAVPLSGAGVFHKGTSGFGGYISPKVMSYNYGQLIANAINDS